MKKLTTLVLALGLSVYSIGCAKPAADAPAETAPAAAEEAAPAEDAGSAEGGSGTTN